MTLSIEGEHSLNSDVDTTKLIVLKHDLAHFLPVLGRIHRRFGEEDLLAGSLDLELLLKGVIPE